jgi:hypothetical protein
VTSAHPAIGAITAHAMSADEPHCLAAGMAACFSKPNEPKALFDAVDRQLLISGTRDELRPTKHRDADAFSICRRLRYKGDHP